MKLSPGSVSIVLPCFNPPDGWEKVVLDTVVSLEKRSGKAFELIIVNDGSTRNVEVERFDELKSAHDNTVVLEHRKNTGKGQALRTGIEKASGEIILFTDIDFPYTEDSFMRVLNALLEGEEVVLGHRDEEYYKHTPFFRRLISKVLRFSLKFLLKLPTDDSQCGIKGFSQKGKQLFLQTTIDRFLFDLEFIKLVSKARLSVSNVEVQLKPNVVFSKVNLKILWREARNFLWIVLKA